ncbi:MAG: ABC transporter ATP-binding protein [Clostridia bacterium]|nr:ABC transporter ATP-binding protein [Clostridia bacterium]
MLQIKNLTKIYKGGKVAVKNLSLEVESGDIYGFIGHNGAGKTTTLKCIAGIIDFEEGEIKVCGKSVKTDPVGVKQNIAFIPDNPDIYEYLTGIQYLNFIADVFGVDKEKRVEIIEKYATLFEIKDVLGNLVSSYSHGMKQKLVLISAFVHSPRLMILDEPFVGLDPKAAHDVKMIMQEFVNAGGAIFFSTHVLDTAEKICNKIAVIRDGEIVVSGKTDELTADKSLENVFLETVDND